MAEEEGCQCGEAGHGGSWRDGGTCTRQEEVYRGRPEMSCRDVLRRDMHTEGVREGGAEDRKISTRISRCRDPKRNHPKKKLNFFPYCLYKTIPSP